MTNRMKNPIHIDVRDSFFDNYTFEYNTTGTSIKITYDDPKTKKSTTINVSESNPGTIINEIYTTTYSYVAEFILHISDAYTYHEAAKAQ
jgi:hypothetical protein